MSEILNKKALTEVVAEKLESTKKDASAAIDAVCEAIADELKKGNKIDISGFGKFEVKERAARQGINPATKEPIQIPATKVPAFKAAKAFKESVK
ncbi:MAG: HU family DNA-binding protein [Erysipelotrichaceae bacterium]|nr:HU family DNA-binding protein [Erysipelotrichaceae bacterium]MCI9523816.1 HU family DNA-binding protein [Erysipelotrichaceae bacterium]